MSSKLWFLMGKKDPSWGPMKAILYSSAHELLCFVQVGLSEPYVVPWLMSNLIVNKGMNAMSIRWT